MQQLQVAYKTAGRVLRQGGRKVQGGIASTIKGAGRFLSNAFSFTKRQFRKVVAFLIISLMNALQFMHIRLHDLAHKKDLLADAPASLSRSLSTTTTCPSSPPVLSRFSSAPTTTTTTCDDSVATASSTPTWISTTTSTQTNAPVVTQATTTPGKKKAQALSVQQLRTTSSTMKKTIDKSLQAVEMPEPSLLGGLFNKLLGGLLVLSTGAIVGYFWSADWREARLDATSQEFIDADVMGSINGDVAAVPITPEASRY
jgi:hypothetical protein